MTPPTAPTATLPAAGMAAGDLVAEAMIRTLVAFDTTSRESNLALIDWVRDWLAAHGVRSTLTFDDDRRTSRHIGLAGFKTNTEEGEIAEIVSRIGPFVAVGRPGESLSYFGAARVSLQHADWQDGVRQLMATAQLVFLRIGSSPGLLWELDEAVRTVRPEKLVLLIPLNRREYDEFRERTRGSFPCQLPEYQGRRIPITSIRAVVCFDHEWIPSIVPVQQTKREYWRRAAASALSTDVFFRTRSKLRDVLEDTLGPIVQRATDVSSVRNYAAK